MARTNDLLKALRDQRSELNVSRMDAADTPVDALPQSRLPGITPVLEGAWPLPASVSSRTSARLQPLLARVGLSFEEFVTEAIEQMPPDFPELRLGSSVLCRRGIYRRYSWGRAGGTLTVWTPWGDYRLLPNLDSPAHISLRKVYERFERGPLAKDTLVRDLVLRQIAYLRDFADYSESAWVKRLQLEDWAFAG